MSGAGQVESEMVRLADGGRYDVTVEVVNAGSISQFFQAMIREPAWVRATGAIPKTFGYGTGDTALEAVISCGVTARNCQIDGYEPPKEEADA